LPVVRIGLSKSKRLPRFKSCRGGAIHSLLCGNMPHILSAYCRFQGRLTPMPASRPVVERVFRKLGGRATLGEAVTSEADLARLVQRRFALKVLASVKR